MSKLIPILWLLVLGLQYVDSCGCANERVFINGDYYECPGCSEAPYLLNNCAVCSSNVNQCLQPCDAPGQCTGVGTNCASSSSSASSCAYCVPSGAPNPSCTCIGDSAFDSGLKQTNGSTGALVQWNSWITPYVANGASTLVTHKMKVIGATSRVTSITWRNLCANCKSGLDFSDVELTLGYDYQGNWLIDPLVSENQCQDCHGTVQIPSKLLALGVVDATISITISSYCGQDGRPACTTQFMGSVSTTSSPLQTTDLDAPTPQNGPSSNSPISTPLAPNALPSEPSPPLSTPDSIVPSPEEPEPSPADRPRIKGPLSLWAICLIAVLSSLLIGLAVALFFKFGPCRPRSRGDGFESSRLLSDID